MRILVLTRLWFPDYIGGTARVARDVASALAIRGHAVTVLAPTHAGSPRVERDGLLEVRRVVRHATPVPRTYSDWPAFSVALRDHSAADVDVVLAHHIENAVAAIRWGGAPVVFTYHASPFREAQDRRRRGLSLTARLHTRLLEPALARQEAIAVNDAAAVLTLSRFSRDLVAEDHQGVQPRVAIVGGGVDVERFSPSGNRAVTRESLGIGSDEKVVLTLRRLVWRMGVDQLLEAMARLAPELPRARLVIIGDGDKREELERRAAALSLGDRVSFLGRLPDEEVRRWYQAADLFVLPSTSYEGFGMVTAEALACGTPVVGTDVGATPEILGPLNERWLVPPESPDALAAGIRATLERSGESERARAREYAERYLAWGRVAERWESALAGAARIG